VPHLLRHGTSVFKFISERLVILISECLALGEGATTMYFKRLRFDAVGTSGARTHDLPDAKLGGGLCQVEFLWSSIDGMRIHPGTDIFRPGTTVVVVKNGGCR
jgi:hypothetical protein